MAANARWMENYEGNQLALVACFGLIKIYLQKVEKVISCVRHVKTLAGK